MIIFKDEYGNLLEFGGFLGVQPKPNEGRPILSPDGVTWDVEWELVMRQSPNAKQSERLVLFSGKEAAVRKLHQYVVDEIEGIIYGKRPFGVVELSKPVNLSEV